jgi:cell division protein FtsZ
MAMPQVFHGRARNAAVEAMTSSGMDKYDIPAFLRKQAD